MSAPTDVHTAIGLPVLEQLAYSQAEPEADETQAAPSWRDVYARAARLTLAGACTAMAIVAVSYVVPRHYSAAVTVSAPQAQPATATGESAPAAPQWPNTVAERRLSPDELFVKLANEGWAPYGVAIDATTGEGLRVGKQTCTYLAHGISPDDLVRINTGKLAIYDNVMMTADEMRVMIHAAQVAYCPGVG